MLEYEKRTRGDKNNTSVVQSWRPHYQAAKGARPPLTWEMTVCCLVIWFCIKAMMIVPMRARAEAN